MSAGCSSSRTSRGFTIVELLVVIIVIAILAVITIVAYSGVTQGAAAASLQSDLSNAATALKAFQIENSNFPSTISTDCSASPDSSTNKCLKISPGNSYIGYSASNSASPKTFLLIASNKTTTGSGSIAYKVTDSTAPAQLANTMQPGVTPGAVLELHAAKANGGSGPGINSPLTTVWTDTSGNGNSGTLTNFGTQTPWGGSGTTGDPYRLMENTSSADDDFVLVANSASLQALNDTVTVEVWANLALSASQGSWFRIVQKTSFPPGWAFTRSGTNDFLNVNTRTSTGNNYNVPITGMPLTDDSLHHLVVTLDQGTIRAFHDGVSVLDTTYCHGTGFGNSMPLYLGKSPSQPAPLQSVSALRIYPFAPTAAQMSVNYAAGPTW